MKTPPTILVSWLGLTDVRYLPSSNPECVGPLWSILEQENIDVLCLLLAPDLMENLPRVKTEIARQWPHRTLISKKIDIDNVSDNEKVYNTTEKELNQIYKKYPGSKFIYNLTSGTPAIHATMLLLGSNVYPGELLRVPDPKYGDRRVARLNLPFTLALLPQRQKEKSTDSLFIARVNAHIFDQIRRKVAPTTASVLILGESGVGKTELAHYLHTHSPRAAKEMISVNCAALPGDRDRVNSELFGHEKGAFTGADQPYDGAFIRANGSTLFLDEIGDLPLEAQGTLLKVLDTQQVYRLKASHPVQVDVRLVAATNRNLLEQVQNKTFREDLYYRLALYTPTLSPLRAYEEKDILAVLERFADKAKARYHPKKLSPQAKQRLLAYGWPGNLRQMRQCLDSIYLLADDEITVEDVEEQLGRASHFDKHVLPSTLPAGVGLDTWLKNARRHFICQALQVSNGNLAEAARRLGMKDNTLRDACKTLKVTVGSLRYGCACFKSGAE